MQLALLINFENHSKKLLHCQFNNKKILVYAYLLDEILLKAINLSMKIIAIIPARYASSRLKGKMLLDLKGLPLVIRVYNAVKNTKLFDDVIIATDDERILTAANQNKAKAVLTSVNHKSGSDRVFEACKNIDCDIVVNVQGDEPFIKTEPLKKLIDAFADSNTEVASLMNIITEDEAENPNNVKLVIDENNNALYFSRAKIPYCRDNDQKISYYKHVGVYAYKKQTLEKYVNLPQSKLEPIEKLEQLRLLENGIKIKMVLDEYKAIGIDTQKDYEAALKLF